MKNIVLLMAAGSSTRMGFDKTFADIGGESVIERSLYLFENTDQIDEIYIVGKNTNQSKFTLLEDRFSKVRALIEGGISRFASLSNGLSLLNKIFDHNVRVIVHNAANPHLDGADLLHGLKYAEEKKNVVFGFFTPNSIKQVGENGIVSNILDRDQIFETQTPQISDLNTFSEALNYFQSEKHLSEPRDEAELLNLIGERVYVYECASSNTKVTFPEDLSHSKSPLGFSNKEDEGTSRIGFGEDAHRFQEVFDPSRPFRLGGVDVSGRALTSDGNSDGDLLLHSFCNALLSAVGEKTFDSFAGPMCRAGITDSTKYVENCLKILYTKYPQCQVSQVIFSLEGLRPKIAPNHDKITLSLSEVCKVDTMNIGLTYTTGEGLNSYGRGDGMRCWCFVKLKDI